MKLNKKAQLGGIAAFAGVVIVLILVTPILLKVATSILGQTSLSLSNIDTTNRSSDAVNFVENKVVTTMDWVVMFIIFANVLLMFVSAFLIDINPAFVVIYLIGALLLVITAPFSMAAAEKIYNMSDFATEIGYIPMLTFLFNNFGTFLVGVIVLTGIIMFAKTVMFRQGGNVAY